MNDNIFNVKIVKGELIICSSFPHKTDFLTASYFSCNRGPVNVFWGHKPTEWSICIMNTVGPLSFLLMTPHGGKAGTLEKQLPALTGNGQQQQNCNADGSWTKTCCQSEPTASSGRETELVQRVG